MYMKQDLTAVVCLPIQLVLVNMARFHRPLVSNMVFLVMQIQVH